MPVINGRLHLPTRSSTTAQRRAQAVGVALAAVGIAAGWWVSVGRDAVQTFVRGVRAGTQQVAERADTARIEVVETSVPGMDAARALMTDVLKDAQAKKAAADLVAETITVPTP